MSADHHSEPDTVRDRGRLIVLGALGLIVATSMTVITLYVVTRGPDHLFAQSIRFLLTLGLAHFIYRGWRWARSLAIILFVGASVLVLTSSSNALLPMGLVYLLSVALLLSPAADRFLRHQEALRLASRDKSNIP